MLCCAVLCCAALGSLRGEKGGPGAGGAGVPLRGRAAAGSAGRGAKGARGAASLWRTAERGWVGGGEGAAGLAAEPGGSSSPAAAAGRGVGGGPGLALGFGLPREGGAEGPAAARPCVAKAVRLQAGPGRFLLANNPCVDGPVFV